MNGNLNSNSSPSPAHALLGIVSPRNQSPAASDHQADIAVKNFLTHLLMLEKKHIKSPISNKYLVSQVFARSRVLKNDHERAAYCRCHLIIALRQFKLLMLQWCDPQTNNVTMSRLMPWHDVVIDYIFDLGEIIPFLERKNLGYVYLAGYKNPGVHSWEVFQLSQHLAYQSVYQGSQFDHKAAQIASIFVLRQALELRFERLIGVYPEDKNGKGPRLKHGFHQKFIHDHSKYFKFGGFSIADLQPVYKWCSEIVHAAIQPFAWQVSWAIEISAQLLKPRTASLGQPWSIANAVEVIDVSDMQSTFENYFLEHYDHGFWRMTRVRPEALVRNWSNAMGVESPDFRPAGRRQSWFKRIWRKLSRFVHQGNKA